MSHAPSTMVDSASISPTNSANPLLNITFPKPTGIRSLPLVKTHETDLKCLPLGYEASASLRQASAISTRLCLAARFPDSAGCNGYPINCESVVLLQDRPSQQPASSLALRFPSTCGRSSILPSPAFHKVDGVVPPVPIAYPLWTLAWRVAVGLKHRID